MGDYFRDRSEAIAGSACCTFITGPSRTADIELTLTLGVHGPGRVIVIVGP
jgi:L-lactate dehydrogenase complex protein LldG